MRQPVIHNEDTDTDDSDDEDISMRTLELLRSNITVVEDTEEMGEVTEWDPDRILYNEEMKPVATSTQMVNAVTMGEKFSSWQQTRQQAKNKTEKLLTGNGRRIGKNMATGHIERDECNGRILCLGHRRMA